MKIARIFIGFHERVALAEEDSDLIGFDYLPFPRTNLTGQLQSPVWERERERNEQMGFLLGTCALCCDMKLVQIRNQAASSESSPSSLYGRPS